jgi:hypothetical protein
VSGLARFDFRGGVPHVDVTFFWVGVPRIRNLCICLVLVPCPVCLMPARYDKFGCFNLKLKNKKIAV